jgi:beta-glucosidase
MSFCGTRLIALVFFLAIGSIALAQKPAADPNASAPYRNSSLSIDERVRDLLGRMTIEEKARQLDMFSGAAYLADKTIDELHAAPDAKLKRDAAEKLIGSLGVGAIHDLYPPPALANEIQRWVIEHARLGIPVLFTGEGLHGFNNGTVFPAPINLASTWDRELAQRTGAAIAGEARSTGVAMLFAPVLDLARDPRWGRVEEDFGEDPFLTGQLGLAWVRGAQGERLDTDHSVIAEPKHFAGHGSPESGTNQSPAHYGERELRTIMLKSFEPAIRAGHAMGVMAAYHEIDGVPVVVDQPLLTGILRNEWGFRGFVLGDDGAVKRLIDDHHVAADAKDAIAQAVNAGLDMQYYDFPHQEFLNDIVADVRDGTLRPQALDRAVSSVLRAKFELGLFDHPYTDTLLVKQVWRSPQHLAVSLQSARESMTLLKNDGHTLPLSKSLQRIAVIGPNAAVARYGDYEDEKNGKRISVADGLRALLPQAQITVDDGSDRQVAVTDAKAADAVILVLGEHNGISGEGFDRDSLDLPGDQEALLEAVVSATEKPVVLVLENGRPLTIDWAAEHVPAILEAWYPGEFGGQAVAEVLFGDFNPEGKLTVTFPRSVGQLPDYYNFDPSKTHSYVGANSSPLFPFGFGLSYTGYSYERIAVEVAGNDRDLAVTVSAVVTNTGNVEGDEIAELYLHHDVSSVEVPDRALSGFARIHLQPGESKTVEFRLTAEHLAVWNQSHQWVVEKGPYTVFVGGSSQAALSAKFSLPRWSAMNAEQNH